VRVSFSVSALIFLGAAFNPAQAPAPEVIRVDPNAAGKPFVHTWDRMFGSGRAILSLRESWRRDLAATKTATQLEYVRFHGIFDDEVGVYDEDAQGRPVYNWSYVDQIYDGMLANNVRPFVELSFMPRKLSSSDHVHAFWYKPYPNPPSNYEKWAALSEAFARHLVERYGIDEVSRWYFEVWNEPNIDFWTGKPAQSTYFQLYDSAARAIKRVNTRLRVGGPATAQAAWVGDFLAHCAAGQVPCDFASTHVYGNDSAKDVFGTDESIPRRDMVARSVRKVYDQVRASPLPNVPIIWSEYNASYMNEPAVTDSPFMGPWLANNIRMCDGLQSVMSYWTFSDVFEEQGVVKTPFYGGYGLIAELGIPKPAFGAFSLLAKLGAERLSSNSDNALITRAPDRTLEIAVWNYSEPEQAGTPRTFAIDLGSPHPVNVYRVDDTHACSLAAWRSMGSPPHPTRTQVQALRTAALIPPPERRQAEPRIELSIPTHGLFLIEVPR
jgi:xylan 1,4-beta-xylosidase